ncbi:MAG TPA: GNAT family N-acetyltransferase [Ktedonobacterales bacterium]
MVETEEISYRRASAEDVGVLAALRWEMEVERHDELLHAREEFLRAAVADTRAELASGAHLAWLAEAGGEPVASALLIWWAMPPNMRELHRRRGFVSSVYTKPAYRRRGIARHLMTTLVEQARAMGLSRLVLWSSEMGRPLYEDLGFIPCRGLELNIE